MALGAISQPLGSLLGSQIPLRLSQKFISNEFKINFIKPSIDLGTYPTMNFLMVADLRSGG